MLTCLKSHEKEIGRSSGWIFLDSANQLFLNARLRVFGNEKNAKNFKLEKHRSIFSKDNKGKLYLYINDMYDIIKIFFCYFFSCKN